jgi:hypothetical protein
VIEYFFVELAIAPGRIKELNAKVDLYLESKICLPEPKSARVALSEACNLKYGIEGQRGAVLIDGLLLYIQLLKGNYYRMPASFCATSCFMP